MALLTNPRHPFKEGVIHGAPDEPGLYLLLFGFDVLYVGMAHGRTPRDTIRALLLAHCNGELPKVPPYNAQATG